MFQNIATLVSVSDCKYIVVEICLCNMCIDCFDKKHFSKLKEIYKINV